MNKFLLILVVLLVVVLIINSNRCEETETFAGNTRPIEKLNNTNCVWGRIPSPGSSGTNYKYLGDFDTLEQCAASPNIDPNAKAITLHGNNSGGYSRQCYSINDNNTRVTNQNDTTCGILSSVPVVQPPKTTSSIEKLDKTNCVWGRIPSPGASGSDYKYLGEFDTLEQCAASPNIDPNAKAITLHSNNSGGYSRQCYSINDNNTRVTNQNDTTCGILSPTSVVRPPTTTTMQPTTSVVQPPPPQQSQTCQWWDAQCRQRQANNAVQNIASDSGSSQYLKPQYFEDDDTSAGGKQGCNYRKDNGLCFKDLSWWNGYNENCKKTCLEAGKEPPRDYVNGAGLNMFNDMVQKQNLVMRRERGY